MTAVEQIDLQSALGRFGLNAFRKGQQEVINHVLAGHDCMCVMPTGGGKSLCYQLPSVVRPGLTIVVSPLIALMKDQVDTLVKRGISATLINSTLSTSEQNQRLDHVAGGHYSMVYVAPERLRNPRFMDSIRSTPVQLLAIDEAHCISEWGHDFRPDYQRLGRFRESLGGVQTIALTATATPRVRQDIVDSLKLHDAKHIITGFARDNLYFGSLQCMGDRDKDKHLLEFLATEAGSGIIYAATRKRCEAVVEMISKELKISAGVYHAGLMPDQRKLIQEQFMLGQLKVIVATNAFGMGIDKSDLRYVIHYNTPGTLEAYYQEAGRAGRDSLASQCVLLHSAQDRYIQEFFIENANPPRELLQMVYEFLVAREEDPIELTSEEIRELTNAPATSEAINSCLQILGRTAVMERLEVAGGLAMFRISSKLPTLLDLLPRDANVRRSVLRTVEKAIADRRDEAVYIHPRWLMQQLDMDRDTLNRHLRELCKLESFEYVPPFRGRAIHFRRRDIPFGELKIDHETLAARKKADYEKLDQMISYAQAKKCRQRTILEYFGDASASNCGICDRCQGKNGWPKFPATSSKTKPKKAKLETNAPPVASPSIPVASTKTKHKQLDAPESVPTEAVAPPVEKSNVALTDSVPTLLASDRKPAYDLIITILKAVQRTHGYLSKTVLAQHLQGVESKAVQGLRLQRLAEFGILKNWKKTHASGFLDLLLDHGVLSLSELRANKVTVCISPLGEQCIRGSLEMPGPLIAYVHQCMSVPERTPSGKDDALKNSPAAPTTRRELERDLEREMVRKTEPETKRENGLDEIKPRTVSRNELAESDERPIRSLEQLPRVSSTDAATLRDASSPTMEDWRWTVRLVQHGYRLGECALIRGKTPDAILDDLTKAIQVGTKLSIENLFDRRTQIAVKELREASKLSDACPPIFQAYPSLWRFVQRWLAAQSAHSDQP
ncbi:MAG: RecQ family ATP-dependent DNA helicase [Pirellula sp.]